MPDGMIKRQEDPPGETRLQVDPNKISMIEWFLPEEDGPYGDSETQVLVDPRFKLALLKAIAPGEVVSYTDGLDGDISAAPSTEGAFRSGAFANQQLCDLA